MGRFFQSHQPNYRFMAWTTADPQPPLLGRFPQLVPPTFLNRCHPPFECWHYGETDQTQGIGSCFPFFGKVRSGLLASLPHLEKPLQ
jgi:hypothetical protein